MIMSELDEKNNRITAESGFCSEEQILSGYDLARKALDNASVKSKYRRTLLRDNSIGIRASRSRRRWSSAGPDYRDPQALGSIVGYLSQSPEWHERVCAATVLSAWDEIVGADISAHSQPDRLNGTTLYVAAESTAWATQLRYLQSQIIAKIATVVGDGVVGQLKIYGPQAPSWRKGPRHVFGRGPRDTYG